MPCGAKPTGKLIVGGSTDSDFMLARYNTNGSLDTSFGTDGISTLDFGGLADTVFAIDVSTDGMIVAAGCSATLLGTTSHFALAQYDADGHLDTRFGGDGNVTTDFGTGRACARGVAFVSPDRIVAVGYQHAGIVTVALASYEATSPPATATSPPATATSPPATAPEIRIYLPLTIDDPKISEAMEDRTMHYDAVFGLLTLIELTAFSGAIHTHAFASSVSQRNFASHALLDDRGISLAWAQRCRPLPLCEDRLGAPTISKLAQVKFSVNH